MAEKLKVGQKAPDFALLDQNGEMRKLGDMVQTGTVVLYFYPKDETPGCTAQACSFRDQYDVFTQAGAQVVGVSADSVQSHKEFIAHHRLPFTLVSDPGGRVAEQYDVAKTLGLFPGRVTFVIDRQGIVRHSFHALLRATSHVDDALAVVRQLAAAAG